MFLFQLTCLLFGLFATVSNAQSQWNGWRLDAGCDRYKTKLDEAYKDVALLAGKASYDLGLVIDGDGGPEPERLPRIRRAITTIFGYRFQNEDPITANDHPVKKIKANFDKVRDPVGQGIVTPPDGHYNLPGGPLVQCSLGQWQRYLADQEDPENEGHLIKERLKLGNALGAWYYEHRFIPLKSLDETAPWLCNGGNVAIVNSDLDSLTLCFPNTGNVWTEGKPLDDWEINVNDPMTDLRRSLPATILHELMHWFTLEEETTEDEDEDETIWTATVEDKPCIDHRGWFVYWSQNTLKCRPRRGGDGDIISAYGFKCSANLARFYPVSAENNADSYAIFALMSFFSDWGWNYGQAWYHDDDYDSVGQYPDENSWRTPGGPADVNEDECPLFNFDA
ncbi:hypothetical protein CEP51_002277 [Fusarium floridanum]|uniref:Lysine-specific metallo-endopeptidase domain-containing protein n=1 Tax=Fusarium floridanum TaxID=1325733 RepID=A0A428SC35_9HYPO|nr:hypothetical protein CEP51_002277 [Fusarium floridanum]